MSVNNYYTFANKQYIYCEAIVSYVSNYTMKNLERKSGGKGATYQNVSSELFIHLFVTVNWYTFSV